MGASALVESQPQTVERKEELGVCAGSSGGDWRESWEGGELGGEQTVGPRRRFYSNRVRNFVGNFFFFFFEFEFDIITK